MFETGDFQTPAPPESGIAGNAVASTPQDHWLYNELVDGFHIDRVVRDYNYSMDIRHIHEEYEIYYLLEGERYYFVNQQTYLVTAGTLVFIDKEQIHRTGMASAGPHHDRIVLGIMEEPFSTFLASFGGLQLQSFFTEQGSILTEAHCNKENLPEPDHFPESDAITGKYRHFPGKVCQGLYGQAGATSRNSVLCCLPAGRSGRSEAQVHIRRCQRPLDRQWCSAYSGYCQSFPSEKVGR